VNAYKSFVMLETTVEQKTAVTVYYIRRQLQRFFA